MLFTTPPQVPVSPVIAIIKPAEKPKAPEPVLYTFISDDVLERVATSQNTTVQRIFDKNPSITNPDVIDVGQTIEIPSAGEQLTHREMPVSIEVQRPVLDNPSQGFFSSGYEFGWCTYYAAQQRPDLHIMDNASGWIRYANSKVPVRGAVAVNTFAVGGLGHVGIVVDFNATQILVRSMNYERFGVVTTDWVDRGYWAGYIL